MLIQVAYGDPQVTTIGARIMARAYGATAVSPALEPVYGLDEGWAHFREGSAYVVGGAIPRRRNGGRQ